MACVHAQVLLVSDGAVWGYTVTFAPGGSGGFKLFVGLIVVVMLVTFFTRLEVTDLADTARSHGHPANTGGQRGPSSSSSSSFSSGSLRPRITTRLPRSTD